MIEPERDYQENRIGMLCRSEFLYDKTPQQLRRLARQALRDSTHRGFTTPEDMIDYWAMYEEGYPTKLDSWYERTIDDEYEVYNSELEDVRYAFRLSEGTGAYKPSKEQPI